MACFYTHAFSLRAQWQHLNSCSLSLLFLWASPGRLDSAWRQELPSATETLPIYLLWTACGCSQFVSMTGMSLVQVLTGEWCCRRVGVEWGLGDGWMLISSELSKLFHVALYPVVSAWLLSWTFCYQHLRLSDASPVPPVEHNA